jgi:glutamate carboxypeptidase
MDKIFSYIEQNADRYVAFLKDICSFEATAYDKQELDRMADFMTEFALSEGFEVRRTEFDACGDFLTVEMNAGAEKGHVFMAHTDTVHKKGVFGSPAVRIEGDRMIGPGTIDCKGGIAIAMLCMKALKENGYSKHLKLLLTSDEEISNVLGGEREQQYFKDEVEGFKTALNCETTENNEVVVSRKGILRHRIDIKGKGGHAGIAYFDCISAVREAAYKIIELEKCSRRGGTTYNCGIVNGGGVANIVPETCSLTVDVRVVRAEDMQEAQDTIDRIVSTSYVEGTTATVVSISTRPPMNRDEPTNRLFDAMQEISLRFGLGELEACESGGGSDSAYTQACGVPSLCGLGGSGEFCHTNREYIRLSSVTQRAKLLSAFCSEN